MDEKKRTAFEKSAEPGQPGLLIELLAMIKEHKKYWLIPLVLVLLAFGLLILLGGTAAAPFIYTLF